MPNSAARRSTLDLGVDRCRNHNRRHLPTAFQFRDKFETVQARHPIVDDQASDLGIFSGEVGTT
jgi:hypothetical protein